MTRAVVWNIVVSFFVVVHAGCAPAAEPDTVEESSAKSSKSKQTETTSKDAKPKKKHRANRLARETSPYLLLHAHNPVDWYPWGPEAFEKAQKENKVIFLSIGYSSCYWCHVMERLVFEDEEIARLMNKNFVNIKVDREERPDVDDIYMSALMLYFQAVGSKQGGGWPLSMFLTPTGKPIAGGTYFPPKDDRGRMGFPAVIERVVHLWDNNSEQVLSNADILTRQLQRVMKPQVSLRSVALSRDLVDGVRDALMKSYDEEHGGFDFDRRQPNKPKFPVPAKMSILQYDIRHREGTEVSESLYHTLDRIAAGGIRDHLGGGFHRYSTDRHWLVPHFEKMLYDQAQLATIYLEAFAQTKKASYRKVAVELLQFVLDEMTGPEGGFHSALDAETDGIEGKHYVWEEDEIDDLLGDDAPLFKQAYGFDEPQVFEHGYVLHLPKDLAGLAKEAKADDLETALARGRSKLLAARRKRPAVLLDDKVLTSWNGLMIRAFADAARILGEDKYRQAAEKSAEFLLSELRDDNGLLLRTYRSETAKLNAYLDDYAFLTEGLLALHAATEDAKWLQAAQQLTDEQIKLFWDEKGSGFYFTSHHHEQLLARTKNAYDSVLPSGNSTSARNLIRLSQLTGDEKYRKYAENTLKLFATQLESNPRSLTNMALALGEFLDSAEAE